MTNSTANRAANRAAVLLRPVATTAARPPTATTRTASMITMSRRRSTRSTSTPPGRANSSHGSHDTAKAPETTSGSLVREATTSGVAMVVRPLPSAEVVLAAHSAQKRRPRPAAAPGSTPGPYRGPGRGRPEVPPRVCPADRASRGWSAVLPVPPDPVFPGACAEGCAASRYPAEFASVRRARRFVIAWVSTTGTPQLADDVALVTSELAANAVIHARTAFDVRLREVPGGVRVELSDRSTTLPLSGVLDRTAMSGRGLPLVHSLAARWGVEPEADGKSVWAEVCASEPVEQADATADELLEMWAALEGEAARGHAPAVPEVRVVIPDVPVQDLLAAKTHMEDLVRELQLLLPDLTSRPVGPDGPEPEVLLAEELDAAVRAFESGRLQVRSQALRAAERGQDRVSLELHLPATAAPAAERYRRAVEAAERLSGSGRLLAHSDALARYSAVRRHYLGEVVRQLRA